MATLQLYLHPKLWWNQELDKCTLFIYFLDLEDFCYFNFLFKLVLGNLLGVQQSVKHWVGRCWRGPSFLTSLVPQITYIPCMQKLCLRKGTSGWAQSRWGKSPKCKVSRQSLQGWLTAAGYGPPHDLTTLYHEEFRLRRSNHQTLLLLKCSTQLHYVGEKGAPLTPQATMGAAPYSAV